ncbi:4Fe-4S binding protein [Anaerohalosphaera lusitana]|nr:4Fe-4S binding protein [Anaerohalosphaera lusitana]
MAEKSKSRKFFEKIVPWRMWFQTAFLLVWLDPMGMRMHSVCSPVFHCYACPLSTFACPIGVMAQFSAIQMIPFVAIGTVVAIGALFGAMVCGWMCPFGLMQDLAAKMKTPRWRIPAWMGHFRYVVLIGTVFAIPYFFGSSDPLFICSWCPAGGLEAALLRGIVPNMLKVTVVVLFVGAIFFTVRPWCRVLCPLGAMFGFLNRFSILSMKLDDYKCTSCKRCHSMCSYGHVPDKSPNSSQCIRCLECTKCGTQALEMGTVFDKGGGEKSDSGTDEDSKKAGE